MWAAVHGFGDGGLVIPCVGGKNILVCVGVPDGACSGSCEVGSSVFIEDDFLIYNSVGSMFEFGVSSFRVFGDKGYYGSVRHVGWRGYGAVGFQ